LARKIETISHASKVKIIDKILSIFEALDPESTTSDVGIGIGIVACLEMLPKLLGMEQQEESLGLQGLQKSERSAVLRLCGNEWPKGTLSVIFEYSWQRMPFSFN